MMDYIFVVIAVLISIHAYTFARWLGDNGERMGMFGVLFLLIMNVALSIYRILT